MTAKRIVAVLLILAACGALFAGYRAGRGEADREAQGERPIKTATHISKSPAGDLTIALDPGAVAAIGLETGPVGAEAGLAVVDEAAVVRDGSGIFAYRAAGPVEFVKTPVRVRDVSSAGGLVVDGIKSGQTVVTRGAQLLLSEELKGNIHMGD